MSGTRKLEARLGRHPTPRNVRAEMIADGGRSGVVRANEKACSLPRKTPRGSGEFGRHMKRSHRPSLIAQLFVGINFLLETIDGLRWVFSKGEKISRIIPIRWLKLLS